MTPVKECTCKALTDIFSNKQSTFCGLLQNTSDNVFKARDFIRKFVEVFNE